MSVPCLRLGSMMGTLLLILLKQWRRFVFMHLTKRIYRFPKYHLCTRQYFNCFTSFFLPHFSSVVAAAPDILSPLSLILESVLQADQQMMERTKAKVFSALISVLQIQGLNGKSCLCCFCIMYFVFL